MKDIVKIRYALPNSGWFQNYLQEIASSLTGGGNPKTDNGIRDVGEYCFASFHEILLASFRIFHRDHAQHVEGDRRQHPLRSPNSKRRPAFC